MKYVLIRQFDLANFRWNDKWSSRGGIWQNCAYDAYKANSLEKNNP